MSPSLRFTERTLGIDLSALETAPAQAYGSIRLLPLLRRDVRGDLRIHRRRYAADVTAVGVEGDAAAPTTGYFAYVPHGLIVDWDRGGQAIAARGTALARPEQLHRRTERVQLLHRMVKREGADRLRLLPLHLALEGYLSLHFGGPSVAWRDYSREALRSGLSPRVEAVRGGASIAGLEEALRLFEIHDDQVGVLVFVADALAAAHVLPHPDDYRQLHTSLLGDLFGELLYRYGLLYAEVGELQAPPSAAKPADLEALRAQVVARREAWRELSQLLAAGILDRPLRWSDVYRAGPFRLRRFVGELALEGDDHIGEAIVRDDGALEYLKTFRLSAAQSRRAFLLERLAAADWSLDRCARALSIRRGALIERLRAAGFDYLLRAHVR
ncbi:MAG: hypothetical protein R3A79_06325 [Nannocystaceae bacterium]